MDYPLTAKQAERTDTLLNLLSNNNRNIYPEEPQHVIFKQLRQSFMTAGEAFKAIDAPTQAVIVPYKQAKQLIIELCAVSRDFNAELYRSCLKKAQKFSVNVFPHDWKKLQDLEAVYEIHPGEGVYFLDECYYSNEFGLATERVAKAEANIL